jgi:hypothetical protein
VTSFPQFRNTSTGPTRPRPLHLHSLPILHRLHRASNPTPHCRAAGLTTRVVPKSDGWSWRETDSWLLTHTNTVIHPRLNVI